VWGEMAAGSPLGRGGDWARQKRLRVVCGRRNVTALAAARLGASRMAAALGRKAQSVLSAAIELQTPIVRPRYRIQPARPSSCARAPAQSIIKALAASRALRPGLSSATALPSSPSSARSSPSPQSLARPRCPAAPVHHLSLQSCCVNPLLGDTVSGSGPSFAAVRDHANRFPSPDTEPRGPYRTGRDTANAPRSCTTPVFARRRTIRLIHEYQLPERTTPPAC
jgi:hypothetical protein